MTLMSLTFITKRAGLFPIAVAIAYLIGLGVFAYFASVVENFPGEVAVSNWVQSWRAPWLDGFMQAFSVLGTTTGVVVVVLVTCALLFLRSWRVESGVVLGASIAGQIVTIVVKEVVARPRPSQNVVQVLQEADSFSFPSNHVMIYTVFLCTLMVILIMKVRQTVALRILQAAFVIVLLLTGYSRIYLGVHWLGDVVGGYAFGVPIAVGAAWLWLLWRGKYAGSDTG